MLEAIRLQLQGDAVSWSSVRDELTACSGSLSHNPQQMSVEDVLVISRLPSVQLLRESSDLTMLLDVMIESLRCVRNAVALREDVRTALHGDASLPRRTVELLAWATERGEMALLRCALQCLGNLAAGDSPLKCQTWQLFAEHLGHCVGHADDKVSRYSCMVLYNLLKDDGVLAGELVVLKDCGVVLDAVFELLERDCEFALLVLEQLCRCRFTFLLDSASSSGRRYALYDIAIACCETDASFLLPDDMNRLKERFKSLSEPLLRYSGGVLEADEADVFELKRLLELLGTVSADEPSLRSDAGLLATSCVLLIAIHQLSGRAGHQFSTLPRLRDVEAVTFGSGDDVQSAASFHFKCWLVRLLGNLVWRSGQQQLDAGQLGVLPVLLECCRLDARNPLLQQWAVLAVRNLCEHCPQNQARIASLKLQGLDPAAVQELTAAGISVVEHAGRIKVTNSTPPRGC